MCARLFAAGVLLLLASASAKKAATIEERIRDDPDLSQVSATAFSIFPNGKLFL
jgi:hypothetical protein